MRLNKLLTFIIASAAYISGLMASDISASRSLFIISILLYLAIIVVDNKDE